MQEVGEVGLGVVRLRNREPQRADRRFEIIRELSGFYAAHEWALIFDSGGEGEDSGDELEPQVPSRQDSRAGGGGDLSEAARSGCHFESGGGGGSSYVGGVQNGATQSGTNAGAGRVTISW